MSTWIPRDRTAARIAWCITGLTVCGIGISLILAAELGAAPWDVFHTGVSELTGVPVGLVITGVGALLLFLWIPLRERPGLGTILNAIQIGLVVDLVLPRLPDIDGVAARLAMSAAGVVLFAFGSAVYIGAGLGPGPRDGLMTGIARRGVSIRLARTSIELTVLVLGIVLGGSIGIGTAMFAFGIGPLVQVFLPHLAFGRRTPVPAVATT